MRKTETTTKSTTTKSTTKKATTKKVTTKKATNENKTENTPVENVSNENKIENISNVFYENKVENVPAENSPVEILKQKEKNIEKANEEAGDSWVTIAKNLYEIKERKLFSVAGYKSVVQYAKERYGIKKSSVYNYFKVIDTFYQTNTIDEEGNIVFTEKYEKKLKSVQMLALVSASNKENFSEIVDSVTENMSARDISRWIKACKAKEISDSSEKTDIESEHNDSNNKKKMLQLVEIEANVDIFDENIELYTNIIRETLRDGKEIYIYRKE